MKDDHDSDGSETVTWRDCGHLNRPQPVAKAAAAAGVTMCATAADQNDTSHSPAIVVVAAVAATGTGTHGCSTGTSRLFFILGLQIRILLVALLLLFGSTGIRAPELTVTATSATFFVRSNSGPGVSWNRQQSTIGIPLPSLLLTVKEQELSTLPPQSLTSLEEEDLLTHAIQTVQNAGLIVCRHHQKQQPSLFVQRIAFCDNDNDNTNSSSIFPKLDHSSAHWNDFLEEEDAPSPLLINRKAQQHRRGLADNYVRNTVMQSGYGVSVGGKTSDTAPLDHDLRRRLSNNNDDKFHWTLVGHALAAVLCVGVAALAAGLTLGMLGLDPLLLLVKERAADALSERQAASRLLPIVKQRHRLLVTLLLMNAAANEALPLFLEQLVSPPLAVLLSVTLVLFFGEIIPSALFTGPNQIAMASALVPLVQLVMWVLYPIAGPIAALLDRLLHVSHGNDADDDIDNNSNENHGPSSATYTRGELSALIRIQYEERLAVRRRRKIQKRTVVIKGDRVGALDFTPSTPDMRRNIRPIADPLQHKLSMRALKNQAERSVAPMVVANNTTSDRFAGHESCNHNTSDFSLGGRSDSGGSEYSLPHHNQDSDKRWLDHSIQHSEVTMIEGALQMQTKVALDVFTAMRKVFTIPSSMLLNESNMVMIYASGFSRIPVHEPGHKTRIIGILVTKLLIVVDPKDARPVNTLPLRQPRCVSPAMPLANLLNMFQSSGTAHRGGHLALVCARPSAGEQALANPGQALPDAAGLMGIITFEDVLESLLQEQIFDEMDRLERKAFALANVVFVRWRHYVQRKKAGLLVPRGATPTILPVVEHAMAYHEQHPEPIVNRTNRIEEEIGNDMPDESTFLLPRNLQC